MSEEDTKILDELEKIRKEQKAQHTEMTTKISALEKIIWLYLGGFSVLVFMITYGPKVVELIVK